MILRLSGRASRMELRDIGDATVMLDDGVRVGGDGTTLLWHALESGATRRELVDRLASECRLDREQAAVGTDRFLRHLRRRGLIVES